MDYRKTAIVTGASRGIGKAVAVKLLENDWNVAGVYYANEKTASELERKYNNLLMIKADVAREDEVIRAVGRTVKKFGNLDCVVNIAGIDIFGEVEDYNPDNWDRMFAVNVKSVFLFSKYTIPYLKKSTDPVIINISSRLGTVEYAEAKFTVYSACKAAVIIFSKALSRELSHTKIRVNVFIPTPTKTDLLDEVYTKVEQEELQKIGKLGKPEEAAELVWELIQDGRANGKILYDKRVFL
ncbi:hypothetical protein A2W14_05205 [Candidatus Gottesmanbacteria bacterium RBG_16_37_8]|uniref:3-oxoacyl-ACP reductase n=1 Tax=Candidatus Gottesmanbacteria bacterium RBG_16_37_8 TaxID=1798371 RepID=A0A1F5YSJ9_9BACT|nr:MAG: hypothetical protein A2W14_05205 [Candidatus Gottesmanbacteria bacterium RBG_16_37_8]